MVPQRTKISRAVLSACGGVALIALSSAAFAQGSGQTVEITGSRIISPGAESSSPLQVITSEEIARSGATNVQDLLVKNPAIGVPGLSRTNSSFYTSGGGLSIVDLRNLGSDRTLVLINGRRVVAGQAGTSTVDLNTIPTEFVDRIEIYTGGASAVYGSDAVAGVVNIIYKKSFNGVTMDILKGQTELGDDKRDRFSMTFGTTSQDGRSNVMGFIGLSKQGSVYARDREGGAVDSLDRGVYFTGDLNDIQNRAVVSPYLSSFSPIGNIFPTTSTSVSYTVGADGALRRWASSTDGFNRNGQRQIAIPTDRMLLGVKGDMALTSNHSFFAEGTYAHTKTNGWREPYPASSGDVYGRIKPRTPAEFLVNGTMVANPIIPASLLALMQDTDNDGARDYDWRKRLSSVGNRAEVAERGNLRLATGLKGDITSKWTYETYVTYGQTAETQIGQGQINVQNFRAALEAIPDPVSGLPICKDATARSFGCVPINILGMGSISGDALAYVTAPSNYNSFISQKTAVGVVRGELAKLPAGPLDVAAGVEYRKEQSSEEYDALQTLGLNASNKIGKTEGDFTVKEIFAESRVPLLKNQPFAKSVTANLAARSSDYTTVGNTNSWTAGLEWTPPVGDLRFRASKAIATRAPNIGELYTGPSQTFAGVTDPCRGVTLTTTGALAEACRAAPGVLANMQANGGVFTLAQPDLQGVSGFQRGSATLNQEQGDTETIGVVWSPKNFPVLKDTVFTMDYYRVKISDAIASTGRQTALNNCYQAGGDKSYCQFVTRRPIASGGYSAGSLEFVDSTLINSGGFVTSGVDLTVARMDRLPIGRLTSRLSYNYLEQGYGVSQSGERSSFAGELGAPRHKLALSLLLDSGPWSVGSTVYGFSRMNFDDEFLIDYGYEPGSAKWPARTYVDAQIGYTAGKVKYYVGIDNLFNTKYPVTDNGGTWGATGVPTADIYDVLLRRFYAGVKVSF